MFGRYRHEVNKNALLERKCKALEENKAASDELIATMRMLDKAKDEKAEALMQIIETQNKLIASYEAQLKNRKDET